MTCAGKPCLGWWSAFVVMTAVRVYVLWTFLTSGSGPVLALGVAEGFSLYYSLKNVTAARRWFVGWEAYGLAYAYFIGWMILPRRPEATNLLAVPFMLGGLLMTYWGLSHLRNCFSSACPSWAQLVQTGPYQWIRHPQALGRLLLVLGVLVQTLSPEGVARCALALLLVPVSIVCEERALSSVREYREYSERVIYRLIPWVW